MSHSDIWEIRAIRYATTREDARKRFHNCMHCTTGDAHDDMPMDFFVWVLTGPGRTIAVDCGSRQWKCEQRGHSFIRDPLEGLRAVGVDPATVDDLVLTHLHWDHAGNIGGFGRAQVHLTGNEMRIVTGQEMADRTINSVYLADDVCTVVKTLFEGRVTFHDATSKEIAPGVSLHEVGGHAAGMQVVRVWTRRGWVVLASDAAHFYTNYRERNPFPVLYNFNDMVRGWDRCLALADSPDHVVPGHDPEVLRRYPPVSGPLDGQAVRLDLDPIA